MKVYRTVSSLEEFEEREKYVFCRFIKQVNYWEPTNEVDFMKTADSQHIMLFSSMDMSLLSDDEESLKDDMINLSVEEFWDKYSEKLSGNWYDGKRVIFG